MKSDREGEPGLAWPYLFLIVSDPHQSRGKPLFCWNNTEGVQIKEGTVLLDYIHEDLIVPTIGEHQIIQDPKFSISLDQDEFESERKSHPRGGTRVSLAQPKCLKL